ncbi:MAG: diaminopimelate epimerase [Campylobacteraceae bacterium]|jgi:diaminopimelate epimerase|nr:diaminopimelate epimerase [Campylobacteraceae bacterium]
MQVSKYNANGNDFIIFHTDTQAPRAELAKRLCDRHEGVGADGLIVVLPSGSKEYDFKWQFYNSDGSEASMCGNGSRACAHYAFVNALAKAQMRFLTGAGVISASVEKDIVEVELTTPKKIREPFEKMGFVWHSYDTGVPHLITIVDDLLKFDLEVARKMRYDYNANINFMTMHSDKTIYVRTYERGVENETMACGTGVAACFCTAYELKMTGERAKVLPRSGEELFVRYEGKSVFFKGRVSLTFTANLSKELNEIFV